MHLLMTTFRPGCFGLLCLMVMLVGCRSRDATVDTSAITVYDGRPDCEYQSLGPVSGRHGNLPGRGEHNYVHNAYGKHGTQDLALQRMKIEAMEKGADAVIVLVREMTEVPPSSAAGAERRPTRQVVYKGVAIRGCSEP